MAKRLFDITSWYNNEASYPDLTLGLPDGEKIVAHKAILCQSNNYFENICGNATPFATPKSTIHLIQSASAVKVLVRTLYGFPVPEVTELSWAAWVDLALTARLYLEPALSEQAGKNFLALALDMTDADKIVHMIKIVEDRHDAELHEVVTLLRKHHALVILESDIYRATILRDPALMLLHIDDLRAKVTDNSTRT